MSSPARPEPDGVSGADAEGQDGRLVDPAHLLDPRQAPPPVPPDNTVTTIMPVIAPWPETAPPPEVAIPPLLPPPRRPRQAEPPPAPPPPRAHDIVTAELVEPERHGPLSAPAATPVPADLLTDASFADALLMSADEETAAAEIRPGPTRLAADSWDVEPVAPVPEESYAGRRRAYPVSRKVWVAIAIVLVGLGAVAVVPFALTSAGRPDRTTALPAGGDPADQEGDVPAISALESSPPGSAPRATVASTGGSTAAAAGPAPATSTSRPANATTQAPPPPATSNPPPSFGPVTFEAEAGTWTGSARVFDVAGASGGRVVGNVGLWFGTAGTVQINGVNLAADGRYTVTIYYVHLNNEPTRNATITISGAAPITTSFSGTSTCCQTKLLANISLTAGVHTILIANPDGHAPSIDKVVVSFS